MTRSKLLTATLIFWGIALLVAMVVYGQEPEIEHPVRRALRWTFEPLPGEQWALLGSGLDVWSTERGLDAYYLEPLGNGQFIRHEMTETAPLASATFGPRPTDFQVVASQIVVHYAIVRPLARALCRRDRSCYKWSFGGLGTAWAVRAARNYKLTEDFESR